MNLRIQLVNLNSDCDIRITLVYQYMLCFKVCYVIIDKDLKCANSHNREENVKH